MVVMGMKEKALWKGFLNKDLTGSKKWLKIRYGRQAGELEMLEFHTWVTRKFLISARDMTLAGKVVEGKSWNYHLLFIGCEVNYKLYFRACQYSFVKVISKNYAILCH